jgi:hypothetical protein
MPLWLLAPLVVFSISLVVWLVKRNGGDAPVQFPEDMNDPAAQAVLAQFRQVHEDAKVLSSAGTPGGRVILMLLEGGETAIAVPFGRKIVFRRFRFSSDIARLNGNRIVIDLKEAGFPPITLDYASAIAANNTFSTYLSPRTPAHA